MLYYIVGGPIDPGYSALALVGLFAMITIVTSVLLVNRKGKLQTQLDYELAKIRLHGEDAQAKRHEEAQRDIRLGEIASKREIEFKRIDSGMIDVQAVQSRGSSGGD